MNLTPPAVSGSALRADCTPGILDPERRRRLQWHESDLVAEERAFQRSLEAGTLSLFTSGPPGDYGVADMSWYYNQRLIKSVPGKKIVEDIYALSPERCPFCLAGIPSTLEHMLPKALFPWLAVEPRNLAPACKDCNLDRREGGGRPSPNVYVDSWLAGHTWLTAAREDSADPSSLLFDIDSGSGITPAQADLLRTHLQERKLQARYRIRAKQAFSDLLGDVRVLRRVRALAGRALEQEVVASLRSRLCARVEDHGHNYWEAAALRAWVAEAGSIDWDGLTHAGP